MSKVGPIQVPSNLSNLSSQADIVRYFSAFASQVASSFNALLSVKTWWGAVGVTGTSVGGSSNYSASLIATGHYHVQFRKAASIRPSVLSAPEAAATLSYQSGVTLSGFDTFVTDLSGNPKNAQFSFIATGGR